MLPRTLIVAAVLAALAGCDKGPGPTASRDPQQSAPSSTAGASQSPTTPANLPQPSSQDEKREGANPQQGQVDPKEREQRRDFQQKGDSRGPSSPETTPRN